jgi:hypothetical protein
MGSTATLIDTHTLTDKPAVSMRAVPIGNKHREMYVRKENRRDNQRDYMAIYERHLNGKTMMMNQKREIRQSR